MTGDLQSHFHTCTGVKNFHFVHFWALGPIAIDSSCNFRSIGPGPIGFHEFSCDFGPKQGSASSQHGFWGTCKATSIHVGVLKTRILSISGPWDLLQSIPRAISDRMVRVSFILVASRATLGQNKVPRAISTFFVLVGPVYVFIFEWHMGSPTLSYSRGLGSEG